MFSEIAKYGLATGLNRGLAFLLLPFLTSTLSVEAFGLYNVIHVSAQLAVSVVTLNGAAGVLREGAERLEDGLQLFVRYSLITISVSLCLAAVLAALPVHIPWWVTLTLALAASEGINRLLLSAVRAEDRSGLYLVLTAIKATGFFLVVLLTQRADAGLAFLVGGQAIWVTLVAVLGTTHMLLTSPVPVRKLTGRVPDFRAVARYAALLIPHNAAQWVLSGSDRLIIKWQQGDAAVGEYSIAYTLAMVLMLPNSGLALALPQRFVKEYESIRTGQPLPPLLRAYSLSCLVLLTIVLFGLEIDRHTFGFIGVYDPQLPLIVGIVAAGLCALGYYYVYSNIIFYHKRTGRIAALTGGTACVNLVLTFWLVSEIGIAGAGVATAISYVLYAVGAGAVASAMEEQIRPSGRRIWAYMALTMAVLFALGFTQSLVWKEGVL